MEENINISTLSDEQPNSIYNVVVGSEETRIDAKPESISNVVINSEQAEVRNFFTML